MRGWSFGFGKLFGGLGKLAGLAQKPFKRGSKKDGKKEEATEA